MSSKAFIFPLLIVLVMALSSASTQADETKRIALLMANAGRQETISGFTEAMADVAVKNRYALLYDIQDADNHKNRIIELAKELVAKKPDLLVAAGGIEADALKAALPHSSIPILFLSVSSAVERGLASDMSAPDRNMTGIETNDTRLTEKRLWFIKKMIPTARQILCFNMPEIVPSVKSIHIAQTAVKELGMRLIVKNIYRLEEIDTVMDTLESGIDAILLVPAAPIIGAMRERILPKAMEQNIPIFGYRMDAVQNGAFAYYAGSRYENGRQAARLAIKLLQGIKAEQIPIETPDRYELVINQWMVSQMEISLPPRVWRMADRIVEISFPSFSTVQP